MAESKNGSSHMSDTIKWLVGFVFAMVGFAITTLISEQRETHKRINDVLKRLTMLEQAQSRDNERLHILVDVVKQMQEDENDGR